MTREVARCYELGCSLYLTKPLDYDRFCDSIRDLGGSNADYIGVELKYGW